MIKVSILYPYRENGRFDVGYCYGTHMPLAAGRFGAALKGWSVDVGINGGKLDSKPPGAVAGHFLFDSLAALDKVFGPAAEALVADIPNHTDGGNGQILISEVEAGG
jgi:uncharacterized protein (TIGR02118 family)